MGLGRSLALVPLGLVVDELGELVAGVGPGQRCISRRITPSVTHAVGSVVTDLPLMITRPVGCRQVAQVAPSMVRRFIGRASAGFGAAQLCITFKRKQCPITSIMSACAVAQHAYFQGPGRRMPVNAALAFRVDGPAISG